MSIILNSLWILKVYIKDKSSVCSFDGWWGWCKASPEWLMGINKIRWVQSWSCQSVKPLTDIFLTLKVRNCWQTASWCDLQTGEKELSRSCCSLLSLPSSSNYLVSQVSSWIATIEGQQDKLNWIGLDLSSVSSFPHWFLQLFYQI